MFTRIGHMGMGLMTANVLGSLGRPTVLLCLDIRLKERRLSRSPP